MLINGKCHCGNISFSLDWPKEAAAMSARAFGCTFCTKHGGVWTSEPGATLSFLHPCAPVSNSLDLRLTASLNGVGYAEVPVEFPPGTRPAKDKAILSAPIEFPAPGNWVLQLRQGPTGVGDPISIPIAGPSIRERLASYWQIFVAGAGALYVAAFALLLLATRYG